MTFFQTKPRMPRQRATRGLVDTYKEMLAATKRQNDALRKTAVAAAKAYPDGIRDEARRRAQLVTDFARNAGSIGLPRALSRLPALQVQDDVQQIHAGLTAPLVIPKNVLKPVRTWKNGRKR